MNADVENWLNATRCEDKLLDVKRYIVTNLGASLSTSSKECLNGVERDCVSQKIFTELPFELSDFKSIADRIISECRSSRLRVVREIHFLPLKDRYRIVVRGIWD